MGGSIFILDDDDDLRDTLSDVLETTFSFRCICAATVGEMIEQKERVLACSIAILDINLGPDRPSGLDAYRWLREHRFRGTVVFLTGHGRSHPLVDQAYRLGEAAVREKPITLANLRDILAAVPGGDGP